MQLEDFNPKILKSRNANKWTIFLLISSTATQIHTTEATELMAQIVVRKSEERGHANHGWLDSYHTFSFADYYDHNYTNWRSLRVINEDRVKAKKGFGTHPHKNAEIFSYVVSGTLAHEDSLGHRELINRGDVQFTSAGTGLTHSEFNGSDTDWVHFIQIWVSPSESNLKPAYATKHFSDEEKKNKLRVIVSPNSENESIKINQDIKVMASILEKGNQISYTLPKKRAGYIHLIQTRKESSLQINGVDLIEGDGAFIKDAEAPLEIVSTGKGPAEFLFFDIE
jgi:hypothetical protein